MALRAKGRDALANRRRAAQEYEELQRLYPMREPDGPTPFEVFAAELPEDAKPFAKTYWHMQCPHKHEVADAVMPNGEGTEPVLVKCKDCGAVRKWMGNRTDTKKREWMEYCPEGFDMFEWEELFVKDRSLWQFIHDEAMATMVEDSMTAEEAA